MAVRLLQQTIEGYTGLSSDSKPTTVLAGTRFFETDTEKTFVYSGAAWFEKIKNVKLSNDDCILLMDGIEETTTSSEINSNNHNAIRIFFNLVSGSGTWTLKIQGIDTEDTDIDCYDNNNNKMSMDSLTASKIQAFVCLPKRFKIVATEDVSGAVVDVSYELFSV